MNMLRLAPCFAGLLLSLVLAPRANCQTLTTMFSHGPSSNRVDLVFVGDGYTAGEIETTYDAHVQNVLDHMFFEGEDPYPRYYKFFNAHRVNVISNESGADNADGPNGTQVDTALNATYWTSGTERLLTINTSLATAAMNAALAGTGVSADWKYATVNHAKYGGAGQGSWATFAGGNSAAGELFLHEGAHSAHGLADEYGGNGGTYSGGEPSEPNVTTDPTGAKWSHWNGYFQPGIGTIGAYEGGRYWDHGIYRPSTNSKMRNLNRPFDAVSREKIILDIYAEVDPVDSFLDNSAPVVGNLLFVDVVDPAVIRVDWSIDGELIAVNGGETLILDADYASGPHFVTARAYDPTDWVRSDRSSLEQMMAWTVVNDPILMADINRDGVVFGDGLGLPETDDIAAFIAGWSVDLAIDDPAAAWEKGDVNLDGTTDLFDWAIVRSAWPSGGRAIASALGIPEPSSIVLGVIVLCAVGLRVRWRA